MFASLLRFYGDFENLLEKEPLQRFNNKRENIVINWIEKTRNYCGVDENIFKQWQIEVRDRFTRENNMALPISVVGEDTFVDSRSAVGYLKKKKIQELFMHRIMNLKMMSNI